MALLEALVQWEAQWRDAGAPVDRKLRPGLAEAEIRAAFNGLEPHADLIAWFTWHGGLADGTEYFPLPPTAKEFLGLEGALRWRSILQQAVPHRAGVPYLDVWIPLLADDEASTILMDQRSGEILRFENLNEVDPDEPPILRISDNLEGLVRRWIAINDHLSLTWSVEDDDVFEYDRSRLTEDELRLGIVG